MDMRVGNEGESDKFAASEIFAPPVLWGRHVYLRPVAAEDLSTLRMTDLSPELGVRFRHRGATPGVSQWVQANDSALAQFLVTRVEDNRAIGLVAAYNQSFQDQYVYFAVAAFGQAPRAPLVTMGSILFLDYVFRCWAFRKIYVEILGYNMAAIRRRQSLFVEEGRLRDHAFYDNRWWDKAILALYREDWEQRAGRWLAAARPAPARVATLRLEPSQPTTRACRA